MAIIGAIGVFLALGCGFKTMSDVEYAKCKSDEVFGNSDRVRKSQFLRVFLFEEREANAVATGKQPASKEETEKARQFIADLKIVNDALPEDQKILKSNGRPIYFSPGTERQREAAVSITIGNTELVSDPDAKLALLRAASPMMKLRESMDPLASLGQTEGEYGPSE